jgi:hypothetical protein
MSKSIGGDLPSELLERLGGARLHDVADRVIVVCSVDDHGFPHAAILSYFEVVATDSRTVRIAVYGGSGTARNARRDGHLTLVLIEPEFVYYIKGTVTELTGSMRCTPHNAKLNLSVVDVLVDSPDAGFEPDAYIASGVRYVNPTREQEMDRARQVLAELRE